MRDTDNSKLFNKHNTPEISKGLVAITILVVLVIILTAVIINSQVVSKRKHAVLRLKKAGKNSGTPSKTLLFFYP